VLLRTPKVNEKEEPSPGDNGFDGVRVVIGLHDEPEEHVDHVYDPDRLWRRVRYFF
jgi:hypothetical protein